MASLRETEAYVKELQKNPIPGSPYALPLPGSKKPGRSHVYRHHLFVDKPLLATLDPEVQTLYDMIEKTVKNYGSKQALGTRPWNPVTKVWGDKFEWLTYGQVGEIRKNLGAGIVELHKRINYPHDKYGVGLWCQNRPEWHIVDFALASQSLFTVSLYETLGPDTIEYIINHSDLSCVVTSLNHIPTLLKLAPRLPALKIIICLDELSGGDAPGQTKAELIQDFAKDSGIEIYSLKKVEEIGLASGRSVRPPRPDDLCTINYTSGTTGLPKGVCLTHSNAIAAVASGRMNGVTGPKDVHFSYLPLAHIYGRMIDYIALASGASVGYFHGDILGLTDDMKILQPTGFISVPRLYNRFNSAIRAATIDAEGVKGALSRHVVNVKKANMKLGPGKASNTHMLYDRIWTPKVRAAVGMNRCHSMISGSAQLDPDVQVFLRAAFGNAFLQGWGMTETYAVGTVQARDDFTTGNIGPPTACVEICVESLPELEYTAEDKPNPRGELLIRGTCLFREYHKNAEETKKTIEEDGWFHTGDICEIDDMGRVKIVDRKKNVLKLAQGEYISPERIENVFLGSSNLIGTAFVHGDGTKASLVGVFGIDLESFPPFASKILGETLSVSDPAALAKAINNPKVKTAFLKKLDGIARSHKFNSFEKIKNAHLAIDPFTIENGLCTPTLKTKRPQCVKAFRKQIDDMYAEIEAQEVNKAKL